MAVPAMQSTVACGRERDAIREAGALTGRVHAAVQAPKDDAASVDCESWWLAVRRLVAPPCGADLPVQPATTPEKPMAPAAPPTHAARKSAIDVELVECEEGKPVWMCQTACKPS